MGQSNYQLTDEQKTALDKFAESFVHKIEDELMNEYGILDPFDTPNKKVDNDKLTAMIWYVGDYISAS